MRRAWIMCAVLSTLSIVFAVDRRTGSAPYKADVVQATLFAVVGLVTAKLSEDARRLRHLAATDDLTGLHNLRSFEAKLSAMVRASRKTGAPLAVLVIDVDRLKAVNDAYGHLAGSEAVRLVGHTLAKHLPSEAVACRYGGDEFAEEVFPAGLSQSASGSPH